MRQGPGPSPDCTAGGSETGKTDAQHAALLNGISSHVHDYDDTHLETIIHPTGPVAAAVLAVAESEAQKRPISGQDLITALVAGIEVECKCGLGVWPSHYDLGWYLFPSYPLFPLFPAQHVLTERKRHITSTTGSIGASAAVSNLLGLTVDQTTHALGLAATQVTGLREMFGSHAKSFHPGRAAQNGVLAAVLARNGYTSSAGALEAKRGWVNVVTSSQDGNDRLAGMVSTLGEGPWEIEKNAFQPFPCGIVVHPVLDGCVRLHDRGRCADIERIDTVELRVHPLVLELTGKTAPRDGLEAKFSVYHGAAVGLLLGKATPAQYEDGVVRDETLVRLRGKVRAVADEACRADECWVSVRMASADGDGDGNGDGDLVEVHVEHAVGSVHAPMSDAQLTEKFMDQCVPVLGADAALRASDWCWHLDTVADVREIAHLF